MVGNIDQLTIGNSGTHLSGVGSSTCLEMVVEVLTCSALAVMAPETWRGGI